MLTFYYHPLSPIARRVWIALLEKHLPFEAVLVNLNGAQLQPEFLALNPFHHVPVLLDGDFRLIESLAILDYLEAQYPTPSLLPPDSKALAWMRMAQMVTVNELTPKLPILASAQQTGTDTRPVFQQISRVLDFLTEALAAQTYLAGETLTLADITAGTTLTLLHRLGLEWGEHGAIAAWFDRITARPSWQQTEPDETAFAVWQRWIRLKIQRHQRQVERQLNRVAE